MQPGKARCVALHEASDRRKRTLKRCTRNQTQEAFVPAPIPRQPGAQHGGEYGGHGRTNFGIQVTRSISQLSSFPSIWLSVFIFYFIFPVQPKRG